MEPTQVQVQGRVSSAAAAYLVQDENLQDSDLQPGKYEGTFVTSEPADLLGACCLEHALLQEVSSFGSAP